jgi:GNAT superfamily N-acetyltransferase
VCITEKRCDMHPETQYSVHLSQNDAMDRQTDTYRIRLARPDEVPRLQEIEDEAGTIFSGLGLIDEALDKSFPLSDLIRLVGMGQVWVGCLEDGLPVGMVIASVREGTVYVEEMDVLPGHGRRGLGARLLAYVCAWAQAQGHATVTLATFRSVPWNGPRSGRRACGRSARKRHGMVSVSRRECSCAASWTGCEPATQPGALTRGRRSRLTPLDCPWERKHRTRNLLLLPSSRQPIGVSAVIVAADRR